MAYVVFIFLIRGEILKEIGEFLKASRIQNGVSVEEASEDLHVASSEIENLEEGNIKAFKDIYYLRDLVKEYISLKAFIFPSSKFSISLLVTFKSSLASSTLTPF